MRRDGWSGSVNRGSSNPSKEGSSEEGGHTYPIGKTFSDLALPAGAAGPTDYYYDYAYDPADADQLKSATARLTSDDSAIAGRDFSYDFDGVGNRADRAYAPNTRNQYTTNPDAGGATMAYDGRGNLTDDGLYAYAYDARL